MRGPELFLLLKHKGRVRVRVKVRAGIRDLAYVSRGVLPTYNLFVARLLWDTNNWDTHKNWAPMSSTRMSGTLLCEDHLSY